jgi:hypothetical protein
MESQSYNGELECTGTLTPPPRKALCSVGLGRYEELLRLSGPTFENFAAQHSYDLILRFAASAGARPAAWAKVGLIQQLLDQYDIVVWVDADTIIMNSDTDIAAEMAAGDWMWLCRHRTPEGLVPNTGVWMFRAGPEAKSFLAKLDAHPGFDHHRWWENAAVIDLLGYAFDPVRLADQGAAISGVSYLSNSWNSIVADPAREPRIKHFAGLPFDVRVKSMLEALANLPAGAAPVLTAA